MGNLDNNDWDCLTVTRVPTAPGKPWKPGKMTVAFPVMEISWNLKNYEKYHGKMRGNLEKWKFQLLSVHFLMAECCAVIQRAKPKIFWILNPCPDHLPRMCRNQKVCWSHWNKLKLYLEICKNPWKYHGKIMEFCHCGKVGILSTFCFMPCNIKHIQGWFSLPWPTLLLGYLDLPFDLLCTLLLSFALLGCFKVHLFTWFLF